MANELPKDLSKEAFLKDIQNLPETNIVELPDDGCFMVFYPKEQHRPFRKILDSYFSLFQVVAIRPEEDNVTGKAFSVIPNHFFEIIIDEEEFLSNFTASINEYLDSPESKRERRLNFHPLPKSQEPYNENQLAFLAELKEPDRSHHAQLFRIGNVTMRYMNNEEVLFDPTEEDFEDWISGLPDVMQRNFRADGLEKSKNALSFRRYFMEIRDISLDDYLKKYLSPEDYDFQKNVE